MWFQTKRLVKITDDGGNSCGKLELHKNGQTRQNSNCRGNCFSFLVSHSEYTTWHISKASFHKIRWQGTIDFINHFSCLQRIPGGTLQYHFCYAMQHCNHKIKRFPSMSGRYFDDGKTLLPYRVDARSRTNNHSSFNIMGPNDHGTLCFLKR